MAIALPRSGERSSGPSISVGATKRSGNVITEFDAGDPDATMHALADEKVITPRRSRSQSLRGANL